MNSIAPQFIVKNVLESVQFYTKKLGFDINWMHKKDPKFAILEKGGVTIMFRQLKKEGFVRPNREPFIESGWHTSAAETWDAYIWVDNADDLYQRFKDQDVSIIKPIQDTEYGNRDFEIEDPDGYILCFGKSVDN
ncbi:VOC family protein [uncultured Psychroserpens sp.]|uniref:VOC family protein n=1 Tax=uncultured Psychroserpens sp. TaxID=255436 RepID=UPI00262AC239|nr:VOC family protein [uncultured Psychroserpens sp.]